MIGLAELVRPLIDEGISEQTLSRASSACVGKAAEGADVCGWLILASIFRLGEDIVSDRPVSTEEIEGMAAALGPLLRRLSSGAAFATEDICGLVNSQPDLVRRIIACRKT